MTEEVMGKTYYDDDAWDRAKEIVDDMSYCCAFEDDFHEWEDLAASSIESFIEPLDTTELEYTIHALRGLSNSYDDEQPNVAHGIRAGLKLALEEMLEYDTSYDIDAEEDISEIPFEAAEEERENYRRKVMLERELARL